MEQKSRDGILAEVSAMAQGYDDIADLLNKLRGVCLLFICVFTQRWKEVSEPGNVIQCAKILPESFTENFMA